METDWQTLTPPNAQGETALIPGTPEWIAERDKRLLAWETSKTTLAAAKEAEMAQRVAVGDFMFPVAQRKEGVNNAELGNGYVLKLGHKVNYNIVGSTEAVDKVQDEIEALGNEGAFLSDRLISWKASLSVGEYKALDPANPTHIKIKALIDSVLETKPGAPSLEIKEPKAALNG